jgi:PTS system nitrogen regulatory IIA component
MKLKKCLDPRSIIIGIEVSDKSELLEAMSAKISQNEVLKDYPEITEALIKDAIFKREKQMSTGIGGGFAFPNARLENFDDVAVCIAVLKNEIDFESFDKKKIHTACMTLTPLERPSVGLKIMSQVAKALKGEETRDSIIKALSPEDVIELLTNDESSIDAPIIAGELMKKPDFEIRKDTPLKKLTRMMSKHNTEAAAVTDPDGKIIGEITCDILFKFGMPDFFSQLKSVSFIEEFDPFEKYFKEESKSVAGDLMATNFHTVKQSTPLLEIVFALAIEGHSKVYVEDDGVVIGEVDKSSVLERIINF